MVDKERLEELARTNPDIGQVPKPLSPEATQEIGPETMQRLKSLEDLNKAFHEQYDGKVIHDPVGKVNYEFMEVQFEESQETGEEGRGHYRLLLKRQGTDFIARVDEETFKSFEVLEPEDVAA